MNKNKNTMAARAGADFAGFYCDFAAWAGADKLHQT
jgi:hypothetical protein